MTTLDLSVLDWFESPRSRSRIAGYALWNSHDGPRPDISATIDRLVSSGHLRELSPQEKLADLDNPSLQAKLRECGLKTSGNKKELVSRLLAALSAHDVGVLTEHSDLVEATDIGRSTLESARQRDEEMCSAAIAATAVSLGKMDIEGALQAVLSITIARGGVPSLAPKSFRQLGDPPSPEQLRSLFASRPDSLGDVSDSTLDELRVAAAMFALWNEDPAQYCSAATPIADLPLQVVVNHLWNEAGRRGKALHFKGSVVLENFQSHHPSCGKCTTLVGKSFEILELAPHLPLKGCKAAAGCPLHFERDWSEETGYDEIEIDTGTRFAQAGPAELAQSLREASGLRNEGLISDGEYEELKARILRRLGEV